MKKLKSLIKKAGKKATVFSMAVLIAFSGFGMVFAPQVGAVPTPEPLECLPVDSMIVLDISGSIGQGGVLDEGILSAKEVIDRLDPNVDRVGLSLFAENATLQIGLTNDFDAVKAYIDAVTTESWTNVGDGILKAREELVSNGRPDARKDIVIITDGLVNRPVFWTIGKAYAISQANAAKAGGIIIYTVGLGPDAYESFLLSLTSPEGAYSHVMTASDVPNITYSVPDRDCYPNLQPIITLAQPTVTITVGDSFDPTDHATAYDDEDGNITGDIVVSGDTVDTATAGTYYVYYDVDDSEGLAADQKTLEVIVEEAQGPVYGPYCGDDIVQPELGEQCDPGHLVGGNPQIVGCSDQCQPVTGECSEKVFARVVVTDVQNKQGTEGMTDYIFLGTGTLPIPSEAWFIMYDGSLYINDPNVDGYEDVPGLAVQRDNGSITIRHYGSHDSNSCAQEQEHVEGYVEFYNAGVLDIANDDNPPQNKMENWGPDMVAEKAINADKDAAWMTDGNKSHFWMTVTVADDSYFTSYELPPVCEEDPESVTIVATKIVCDNEESLPNWGSGGSDITSTTATEFVAANPGCHLTAGWDFQIGDQNAVKYAGDYRGEASEQDGWTTFGPTDSNGVVETIVTLEEDTEQLHLREVLPDGYIPFTYPPNDNPVSAEFYCHTDVFKYDNYDWIFESELVAGMTYYCVAFNALEVVPTYECSDGQDNDGDQLIDEADPGCWTDSTDPSTYDPQDNDETNGVLPECSDYIDNDGDGYIDADDVTCSREGIYDPTINDEENQIPIITVDPVSITLTVGGSFDPYDGHATASDFEDGDITSNIMATGAVDTGTIGVYYVDYNVDDSEGEAAETKTLEVIVEEEPTPDPYCGDGNCDDGECCSSCPQDCGPCPDPTPPTPPTGGGGGIIPLSINNSQTKECVPTGEDSAISEWMTNKYSSSQVVCSPDGHNPNWGSAPDWGYSIFTDVFDKPEGVTNHSVEIFGLSPGTNYCRYISTDGNNTVFEELECVMPEVAGVEAPPVTECSCPQLLGTYIKLGAENNPNDVRGLEWVLNEMGYTVPIDSFYGMNDFAAVSQMQTDNNVAILSPWFLGGSTGYVYYTTQKFVNEWYCDYIGCPKEFRLTPSQEAEISWYGMLQK